MKVPSLASLKPTLLPLLPLLLIGAMPLDGCKALHREAGSSSVEIANGNPTPIDGHSAVLVYSIQKQGNTYECSGTFIDDTTFVTAAHCVTEEGSGTVVDPRMIEIAYLDSASGISPAGVFVDPTYVNTVDDTTMPRDIAVLRFPRGTSRQVGVTSFKSIASQRPDPRTAVILVGFGLASVTDAQPDGKKRTASSRIFDESDDFLRIYGDCTARSGGTAIALPGDSGGPMLDSTGTSIFGVFSRYSCSDDAGASFAKYAPTYRTGSLLNGLLQRSAAIDPGDAPAIVLRDGAYCSEGNGIYVVQRVNDALYSIGSGGTMPCLPGGRVCTMIRGTTRLPIFVKANNAFNMYQYDSDAMDASYVGRWTLCSSIATGSALPGSTGPAPQPPPAPIPTPATDSQPAPQTLPSSQPVPLPLPVQSGSDTCMSACEGPFNSCIAAAQDDLDALNCRTQRASCRAGCL